MIENIADAVFISSIFLISISTPMIIIQLFTIIYHNYVYSSNSKFHDSLVTNAIGEKGLEKLKENVSVNLLKTMKKARDDLRVPISESVSALILILLLLIVTDLKSDDLWIIALIVIVNVGSLIIGLILFSYLFKKIQSFIKSSFTNEG